ncbi:MAG: glycosyltransferase [Dysgonomonas sp.]
MSVTESNIDFDIEIIVVDNNSTDGSVDYLIPKFPTVKFIANKNNPGFAKANNQAIKISTGDQILLLNPDTLVGENTLKNVFHFLSQTSDAGAAGVKMINGSGLFLPESKKRIPYSMGFFLQSIQPK